MKHHAQAIPLPIPGIDRIEDGGAEEDRTPDLFNAIEALSQLSYSPTKRSEVASHQTCLLYSKCSCYASPPRASKKPGDPVTPHKDLTPPYRVPDPARGVG